MEINGLLGLFCGIAVFAGVLLGFNFIKVKKPTANFWLGLLFLAITLRVAKSIWYFILYDVASIGLAFGFLGLSMIGPLLLITIQQSRAENTLKNEYAHFVVPAVGFLACFILNLDWVTVLYKSATAMGLVYAIWALILAKQSKNVQLIKLALAVSLVIGCFVFQHLSETMAAYAWGGATAGSILLYFLFSNFRLNSKTTSAKVERIDKLSVRMVHEALQRDRLYLNAELSINSLASQLSLPSYKIPMAVKAIYQKSFPEAIKSLRVAYAIDQLSNNSEFMKMEVLALESGFKSTSAFYAAFKKETGKSPKEYQKAVLHSELKSRSLDLAAS